jgi:hypothetical protein
MKINLDAPSARNGLKLRELNGAIRVAAREDARRKVNQEPARV